MDLTLKSSRIRLVAKNHCSVGFVERIITRRIVSCITVIDLRFIVHRRHKLLGMLDITFLGSMHNLITSRKIMKNPLLRCKVSYVI